jgi:type VI secretion system (T6SS) effector TldE1-like protein
LGARAIPVGIAAMVLGFVLKSPGTQAGPADPEPRAPGVSVFGTIHPDVLRLGAPLGSGPSAGRIRLASLEFPVGSDAPINAWGMVTDTSASACRNTSADERFAVLGERPASFDKRFASADDCPASFDERFDERFGSAMRALASSLRLPPEQEVQDQRADATPKPAVSKADIRPRQARKEIPPLDDDGRTAIYDITAQTVYLPSGRRLEAHSGLGAFMDNPRHVHVRMRGATPPNIYRLSLRERLFHGVRAIRLNPVDDDRMHGRAGILAHTYMLGANGQSNGCVSFRNYPEFLSAFLNGEITRIAVVERLESPPGRLAAGQLPAAVRDLLKGTDRSSRQYAAAGSR